MDGGGSGDCEGGVVGSFMSAASVSLFWEKQARDAKTCLGLEFVINDIGEASWFLRTS